MALNKQVLKKIREKTAGDRELQEFLLAVFQYESESNGWFKPKYKELLERHRRDDTCV